MDQTTSESSDESDDDLPGLRQIGRKRVRNPQLWKRNVKKKGVVHGEAHYTASGKPVAAKTIGPPCTCRRHCFSKFNPETINSFVEVLYALDSKDLQDAHLAGLISSRKIARRRTRDGSRSGKTDTYTYKVTL